MLHSLLDSRQETKRKEGKTIRSTETIRQSLAMGLDEAIHIETEPGLTDLHVQPLTVAKIFRHFILKNQYDLILLGKQVKFDNPQSIDDDSNQTGQILAGMLDYPQATFLSGLEYKEGKLKCLKEIDAGIQEVSLPLPAIATVDLRLNKPRHTKIQNIIKAKKKKIETHKMEDILENEDDRKGRLQILEVQPPTTREGGVIVESVDELLDKLKNEAKVLEMN